MTLPTWEIVIITLIALTIFAVSVYFVIKCWKSIKELSKNATKRVQNARRQNLQTQKPRFNVSETYGVPYPSPTPAPRQLDPAKLESMVMGGKSDLHPRYLEPKIDLGDIDADASNIDIEHNVSWSQDSYLVDSEFMPSMTEAPIVEVHMESSSPKPKKIVHITYDRGEDGAPEIKSITTSTEISDDTSSQNTTTSKDTNDTNSLNGIKDHVIPEIVIDQDIDSSSHMSEQDTTHIIMTELDNLDNLNTDSHETWVTFNSNTSVNDNDSSGNQIDLQISTIPEESDI